MLAFQRIQETLGLAQLGLNPHWMLVPTRPDTLIPELPATAILALRTARQAISASPQNGKGYLALALAYSDSNVPTPMIDVPGFNRQVAIISLERFLARTTPQEQLRRGNLTAFVQAKDVCNYQMMLVEREHPQKGLERPRKGDLVIESARRLRAYLRNATPQDINKELLNQIRGIFDLPTRTEVSTLTLDDTIKRMDSRILEWESRINEQTDIYLGKSQQWKSPVERALQARRAHALYLKALEELKKLDKNDSKLGLDEQFTSVLEVTDLSLLAGQVEEAIAHIDAADDDMKAFPIKMMQMMQAGQGQIAPQQLQQYIEQLQQRWWDLKMQALCPGGFATRDRHLASTSGGGRCPTIMASLLGQGSAE